MTCIVCDEPRPEPKSFRYVSRAEWERDPFCSTVCAKAYYGIEYDQGGYGLDYGATSRKELVTA